jgi:hypothetical protein
MNTTTTTVTINSLDDIATWRADVRPDIEDAIGEAAAEEWDALVAGHEYAPAWGSDWSEFLGTHAAEDWLVDAAEDAVAELE